ncbi:MAG: PilZ domain-containing protein [Gammaproteobacteria bacterium]|nr:PilZ domain-containing protein [Gammaproteobacteria bacterium]
MADSRIRNYIRHPSDIPIEIHVSDLKPPNSLNLVNISVGGLAYQSDYFIEPGLVISVRIPTISDEFQVTGEVTWCRKSDDKFDVGIQFNEQHDLFNTRMIEQICHIEHYKRHVQEQENRTLSGEEAALEWIEKYAATFPDPCIQNLH